MISSNFALCAKRFKESCRWSAHQFRRVLRIGCATVSTNIALTDVSSYTDSQLSVFVHTFSAKSCQGHLSLAEGADFRVRLHYIVIRDVPLEKDLDYGGVGFQSSLVVEIVGVR